MVKYKVYVISYGGQGRVQELQDWDGDELEIVLSAFDRDAVIQISPDTNQKDT